jgi:hypothetical protein
MSVQIVASNPEAKLYQLAQSNSLRQITLYHILEFRNASRII